MQTCPTCDGTRHAGIGAGCQTCHSTGEIFTAPELLEIIVANARLVPDPSMEGTTDCYHVPVDDIDAAGEWLKDARTIVESQGKETMENEITVRVRDLAWTQGGTYTAGSDMAADLFDRRTGPVDLAAAVEWFEDQGYRRAPEFMGWGTVLRHQDTGNLVSLNAKTGG